MYFHKYEHPLNFSCKKIAGLSLEARHLGEDVYRLTWSSGRWKDHGSAAILNADAFGRSRRGSVEVRDAGFRLLLGKDELLSTVEGEGFGVLGPKWVINLNWDPEFRFYGLGEKNTGLEKTGTRTKFWNTDVWADFHPEARKAGVTDPMYASVPYLLVRNGRGWAGILVNNPWPVFMHLLAEDAIAEGLHGAAPMRKRFAVGSTDGRPEIYLIAGESAAEVTTRLQRLVGTTPLPPLWALGYHQSRWGYASFTDLDRLDREFARRKIPCDGLWLDIDYMEGFRVFTFDERHFSSPKNQMEDLKKRGRRVVAILDPGVKADPDFDVYREGAKGDLFCKTAEGRPFVGIVWPGETVFPDFSLPQGREWWAQRVASFAGSGVGGLWIDMNDPSTGPVDPRDMLFGGGRTPHEAWHNQYALGMQQATWDGLLRARPGERPFLATRSAFISSGRYGAVWTGDNWSNYHHLRQSLTLCLNMSLSGLPFCGGDVPGFGGDADPALATAWFKACFLFPLFRNHGVKGCRDQEPWAFGGKTEETLRRYIRLRYRLLPYLYSLFVRQEEAGEPILRPLFYDFGGAPEMPLDRVEDQFMVGPHILQAPVLGKSRERTVLLPGEGLRWFSPSEGVWSPGNAARVFKETSLGTPLFVREGAILPMLRDEPETAEKNLAAVEFHVFLTRDSRVPAEGRYAFDDGETFRYRKGFRTSFRLAAEVKDSALRVELLDKTVGHLPCQMSFVLYDRFDKVILVDGSREVHLPTEKAVWDFPGKKLTVRRTRDAALKA